MLVKDEKYPRCLCGQGWKLPTNSGLSLIGKHLSRVQFSACLELHKVKGPSLLRGVRLDLQCASSNSPAWEEIPASPSHCLKTPCPATWLTCWKPCQPMSLDDFVAQKLFIFPETSSERQPVFFWSVVFWVFSVITVYLTWCIHNFHFAHILFLFQRNSESLSNFKHSVSVIIHILNLTFKNVLSIYSVVNLSISYPICFSHFLFKVLPLLICCYQTAVLLKFITKLSRTGHIVESQ